MKTLIAIFTLTIFATTSFAHGDKDHDKKEQDTVAVPTEQVQQQDTPLQTQEPQIHAHQHTGGTTASFSDFPSLHPLVVHFPIALLLFAFILQAASLFVFREPLSWVALITLALGFAGAIIAGKYVHPHTASDISEHASLVLSEHEQFASLTVWLSGAGLLLKLVSHFLLKRKIWLEAIIAVILLGAAACVSMAGHHGAQLVHIEGIGPQGKYLEIHHHHDH